MANLPKSLKAEQAKSRLIVSAAALLREKGPAGVTYRSVAQWAGMSPSSTSYYFDSITDLLSHAGEHNIGLWARRAESVVEKAQAMTPEECRSKVVELLIKACLPKDVSTHRNHYIQLVASEESEVVTKAYRRGRARLDSAVNEILQLAGLGWIDATMIIAVVDGGAIEALSEGRSVVETVSELLKYIITAKERWRSSVESG
ncbi:MAG: TetR/AcrR family transcriptional regulator [Actinomycetaceae bacterium]|nr:TetR/AcrR family transcriptional regulator [Actinomycetaceae bacterium]